MTAYRWSAVLALGMTFGCAHEPEKPKPFVDEFVGFGALRGEPKKKEAAPAADEKGGGDEKAEAKGGEAEEKTALTKEQVLGALETAKTKVNNCLKKFREPGIYVVEITIDPAGTCKAEPIRAPTRKEQPDLWTEVPGKIDGGKDPTTPTNRCLGTAISSVKFPEFEGKPLVVTYPIVLK